MKTIIYISAGVMGAAVVVPFVVYIWFGFMTWLLMDPFNWIQTPPTPKVERFEDRTDFKLCADSGGVPIRSGWTGAVKRCDK